MDSLKGTLTPMKVLNGTLNGGIAYGTFNYNELENKPSINGILLQGNVVIFIPVKTSDLANDSGFITSADIPTKLSELINDAGFITITDVPTKLSELLNDAGFITLNDIPAIPTKTSELNNDSGFLTMLTTPVRSVNSLTGDVNLFIPNATSQLTNDAGFITDADAPVKSVNGQTGNVNLFIPNATSQLNNDAGFITNPQTGTFEDVAVASFSDGADDVPVSELIVDIEARQEGSGTPSPDNVRAISGFNSGLITRCGVNLWDEEWETGTINAQGEPVGDLNNIRSKNFISIKGSMTIYGVCPISLLAYYYDENKNFISGVSDITNRTETTPLNACYMKIRTGGYGGTYNNDISINYPSSDTQYHAYNGNTYTVDFGQTVYGGHFDNKGNLVVTHGYIASYNGETINEPWISSMGNYVPNTSPSTGSQVVYPLTTPTTIAITSQNVATLLGNNNIFADTGNINKLVYFKTGCEAIAKLIEAMI